MFKKNFMFRYKCQSTYAKQLNYSWTVKMLENKNIQRQQGNLKQTTLQSFQTSYKQLFWLKVAFITKNMLVRCVSTHTNFSQSDSAFWRRRISTSTWLRACFSLTSSAPLSVSALASTSLQEAKSCSTLSHLRRQSSKFSAIWMNSGKCAK